MSSKKTQPDSARLDRIVAEARHNRDEREHAYRERALKMYPWVCGRCGREYTRENVRELTVHHRDHDHDNNPPDGSNWELLCLYCHDNEHSRYLEEARYGHAKSANSQDTRASYQPFADLKDLLKRK